MPERGRPVSQCARGQPCGRRRRRLGHGIYLAHSGELDWWARASAAVLRSGAGAALSAESAAFVHGLLEKPPAILTVAVPDARHPARLPGMRVRRRSRLVVVERHRLPATSAAQTVIDLAAIPGTPWREAVTWCARAVQQHRVTVPDLVEELAFRGRHPHRRVLQVALGVIAEGAETAAEVDYVRRVERPHGLPHARLQVVADLPGGRVRRDAEYEPWGVVVELDGSVHADVGARFVDVRRDRQTAAEGRLPLRATNTEVFAAPCDLAVDVVRTLRRRGFRGAVRACRPACPVGALSAAA